MNELTGPWSLDVPWPMIPPFESKPGETGHCAWCGMDFTQMAGGLTAGNYCEVCWERRNLNIRAAVDKMNKFEKRRPYYVAAVIIGLILLQIFFITS